MTAEVATDQDEGPAGEVAYAITAGNEDQFFLIDETGDVRVASSPLLPGMYSLTITASDHGAPPLATSAVLIITVEAVGGVDCSNSVYSKNAASYYPCQQYICTWYPVQRGLVAFL